jgi:DNA-binding MarR family transcriptional regulator
VSRPEPEPARLRLVTLLYVVDEADFVYLSTQTGLTAGNISSHMTKLETAGYSRSTRPSPTRSHGPCTG